MWNSVFTSIPPPHPSHFFGLPAWAVQSNPTAPKLCDMSSRSVYGATGKISLSSRGRGSRSPSPAFTSTCSFPLTAAKGDDALAQRRALMYGLSPPTSLGEMARLMIPRSSTWGLVLGLGTSSTPLPSEAFLPILLYRAELPVPATASFLQEIKFLLFSIGLGLAGGSGELGGISLVVAREPCSIQSFPHLFWRPARLFGS